ncbi:hypothetical protein [Geobacter sp. AOG1]|uniref:hypothetical protein n=1 Tax=Geobacter sp. AOG1 TaxID=1566346 RepID=UPI001CC39EB4|nr:hypothetical protein [Geobacter sp. AOG1]GFE58623.1 hypothetical protein AOG1_25030 [Geobacter sp. AOG1]
MAMKRIARHTWLFSFTDVAFLLLLVWTQVARLNTAATPVAEMQLPAPVVAKNPELTALKTYKEYQQVLIEKHSERPYRLTRIVSGKEVSRSEPMTFAELASALHVVYRERSGTPRPVVVPLPESFSSDLLQAAALVSKLWNVKESAVVHLENEGKR